MGDQSNIFESALFDVEHAICMHASSYAMIPASGIYNQTRLNSLMNVIKNCHVYMIGYTPKISFVSVESDDPKTMVLKFSVIGKDYAISYSVPNGTFLKRDGDTPYLEDMEGRRSWPSGLQMMIDLNHRSDALKFEVQYIGQAYGKNGSRNAIDRLRKHETLQKIALNGVPEGYELTLLLFEIEPSTRVITVMNPFAKTKDGGNSRLQSGLNKLFDTTEQERISLYEAALISYFRPEYNVEFKDSFPSTNLKILQGCYHKDFAALVAEICIDRLPVKLWSKAIPASLYHIVKCDLHEQQDRKMFFGL